MVTWKRFTPTPRADLDGAGAHPDIPSFPWWILVLAASILAAGVYVWWAGRPPRRPRTAARDLPVAGSTADPPPA